MAPTARNLDKEKKGGVGKRSLPLKTSKDAKKIMKEAAGDEDDEDSDEMLTEELENAKKSKESKADKEMKRILDSISVNPKETVNPSYL